jgi:hypothetical protein
MAQWMFNSFNQARFRQFFGKGSDTDEKALQSVVEFEMGSSPGDELSQLAQKLARQGISYANLSPREAEAVDQVLAVAFGPEGLWTELELESESAQGLSTKAVDELLKRAQMHNISIELLPALKKGRRCSSTDLTPSCHYVLFDRNEVPKVAAEVRSLLDSKEPWSSPALQSEIMDGLLMVFEYVARKNKALAGVLS